MGPSRRWIAVAAVFLGLAGSAACGAGDGGDDGDLAGRGDGLVEDAAAQDIGAGDVSLELWDGGAGAKDGEEVDAPGRADDTQPESEGIEETESLPEESLPVVLMSGFEAFGGYETNPSWEALLALDGQVVEGLEVHVVELPVEWGTAWEVLDEAIGTLHPRVVIATGMATTPAMRYEVNAVNKQWGKDNAGINEKGTPVVADGPESLVPSLPVGLIADAFEDQHVPVTISDDAGTYLCNHVMYHLLYYAQFESGRPLAAGFVHVPPAPYEGPMTVEDITQAHVIGLEVVATWLADGAPDYTPLPRSHTPPEYFLPGYE